MDSVQFLHYRSTCVLTFLHDILIELTKVGVYISLTLYWALASLGRWAAGLIEVLLSHLRHYYILVGIKWHFLWRFRAEIIRCGVYCRDLSI